MYTNSQDEVMVQNLDNEVLVCKSELSFNIALQNWIVAPTLVPTIQRKEEIWLFTSNTAFSKDMLKKTRLQ
jgi:hypothetical protein